MMPGVSVSSHDPRASCAALPCRALEGPTRSLVTFTPAMFEMIDGLKVAAAHDVTILLTGETGSGKTYLARLIHELSPRQNERCLTVTCGAVSPEWIESELFGCVKGALPGVDADRPGKLAAASQGTLLLEEIDTLTPEQQVKLLRVIETGEYEMVGSNDAHVTHARLIVSSRVDLESLVAANHLRMDLGYRLGAMSFHLLPLRQRVWDLEYLARKFAFEQSRTHQIALSRIEPEFLGALRGYLWPGNLRELENVIRRAVLYCGEGVLALDDLPSALQPATKPPGANGAAGNNPAAPKPPTLEKRIEEVERRIIEETLERHNHHRTDTARELGISRVTLYNKMRKFGMLT
jgi:DNA-binding NtrC family response regulator